MRRIVVIACGILILLVGSTFAFTDNGDNTITDSKTGLVWQKLFSLQQISWEKARSYCQELTLVGKTDCRLPKLKELESIVVKSKKTGPKINEKYFPHTISADYWTADTSGYGGAWIVDFRSGGSFFSKPELYYVRCVRSRN